MTRGSRYWASTCIVLNNGDKIYVEESDTKIKKTINSQCNFVDVTLATTLTLCSKKLTIPKGNISYFHKV